MSLSNLRKKVEGFTIIEVLIVLAIAGLILLIVFLAVPALQRNSRNTQRKNDVSAVASAISNFVSNNGGAVPTASGAITGASDPTSIVLYCSGASPTPTGGLTAGQVAPGTFTSGSCTTTNNNYELAKVGYYKPGDKKVFFANTGAGGSFSTAAIGSESAGNISTNSMTIDLGYSCNASNTGVNTTSTSNRSVALLYVVESGSGNGNMQCVDQ